VYRAGIRLSDAAGVVRERVIVVTVHDPAVADQKFLAIWNGITGGLAQADHAEALHHLNQQAQRKFAPVFEALAPRMPEILASFSVPARLSVTGDIGGYVVVRNINGVYKALFLYFLRNPDGVWQLDEM
jgi:hypothetical protein